MNPAALTGFERFVAGARALDPVRITGRVGAAEGGAVRALGLSGLARIGDHATIDSTGDTPVAGEVVALGDGGVSIMAYGPVDGVREGDAVHLGPAPGFYPCADWLGSVIDAFGHRADGGPTPKGALARPLRAKPPSAVHRRRLGERQPTGLAVLDTLLPLVAGQRTGLFAGSGVGKSRLLGRLAQGMAADIVVIGLIGERGREVRDFVEDTVGAEAMRRCVVVAATSDQPAPVKRRAAFAALATAEHFRDEGAKVLLLFDSLTRFAEAHREIALTAGEAPSLRAYPPSTAHAIAGLCERAGPGPEAGTGDITAVFTVLVAGSDMEEPVADITRGVLDGHIILDRTIAERGRFPAIDARRSVSRSLPDAATPEENALIGEAREVFGLYDSVLPMVQTGLYQPGGDARTDRAVRLWPALDAFCAEPAESPAAAFSKLARILEG